MKSDGKINIIDRGRKNDLYSCSFFVFSQNMSLVRKVQNGNLQECIQGPVKRSTGNKHVSKAS